MQAKTLENYGAPYADHAPVENPETDLASDYGNRLMEDVAQLTQTGTRAIVKFTTKSGGALPFDLLPADISHWTVWGSGPSTRPTVTKTAQGRYTITFAATYNDGLAVPETVVFLDGLAGAMSSDPVDEVDAKLLTIASNVVTLKTIQAHAAPPVIHDIGNNSAAVFTVSVWLR